MYHFRLSRTLDNSVGVRVRASLGGRGALELRHVRTRGACVGD